MKVGQIEVRHSPVHGRGVFAVDALAPDDLVGWYAGEVIDSDEADNRYLDAPPGHTMLFARSDGKVIDGSRGGNHTSFLNHGCAPNCHAEEHPDGRIAIVASADLPAGTELLIDYQLQVDPDVDPELYSCRCGAASCRGTMAEGPIDQK